MEPAGRGLKGDKVLWGRCWIWHGASAETFFCCTRWLHGHGHGHGHGWLFSEHFLWRLGVFKDDTPVGNSYFVFLRFALFCLGI